MGHLNELQAAFANKGLLVVGVALDSRQTQDQVKKFSADQIKYSVVWDAENKVSEQYDVQGIPAAYILDKDNKILWTGHPKKLTSEKVEELLGQVQ